MGKRLVNRFGNNILSSVMSRSFGYLNFTTLVTSAMQSAV